MSDNQLKFSKEVKVVGYIAGGASTCLLLAGIFGNSAYQIPAMLAGAASLGCFKLSKTLEIENSAPRPTPRRPS